MTLPARVFCDTSFFYACLDSSDVHHRRAAELIGEAAAAGSDFLSTWDVVSETATLLRIGADRSSVEAGSRTMTESKSFPGDY